MHEGEENHTLSGQTTSIRAQDSPWKSIGMTEDRDKWRKFVHGVANPRIEDMATSYNNKRSELPMSALFSMGLVSSRGCR